MLSQNTRKTNVGVEILIIMLYTSSSSSAFDVMTVLNPQAGGC